MSKRLDEIAGARCSFCKRPALPEKGGVDWMAKGLRGFACKECLKRCAELVAVCPVGGVLKFKPRGPAKGPFSPSSE